MTVASVHKSRIFWPVTIGLTVLIAIYSTIYSLTHGIHEVFPFSISCPSSSLSISTRTGESSSPL
jgi:hypothetical protein